MPEALVKHNGKVRTSGPLLVKLRPSGAYYPLSVRPNNPHPITGLPLPLRYRFALSS